MADKTPPMLVLNIQHVLQCGPSKGQTSTDAHTSKAYEEKNCTNADPIAIANPGDAMGSGGTGDPAHGPVNVSAHIGCLAELAARSLCAALEGFAQHSMGPYAARVQLQSSGCRVVVVGYCDAKGQGEHKLLKDIAGKVCRSGMARA